MQRHFIKTCASQAAVVPHGRPGRVANSAGALQALVDRDSDLAVDVIKQDHDVNGLMSRSTNSASSC